MKLLVYNGSPRGEKSNTQCLLDRLAEGFLETPGNTIEAVCLRNAQDMQAPAAAFADCDMALLAFPLYVDAMPAMVKEFIEALAPVCGRQGNPALGFVVISGFPEAVHTSHVKRYLEKLAARLGCRYAGTVTRGDAEGIRWSTEKQNRKIYTAFRQFGRDLAAKQAFNEAAVREVAGAPRFSGFMAVFFRLLGALGLTDKVWNDILKKTGSYERRLDRPYI